MPQGEVFVEDALKADGSRGATADQDKPILQLYRLLRSPAYVNRFESNQAYIERMLVDLIGTVPLEPVDRKIAKKIRHASDHNQVVEMLKCKTFFVLSERWKPEWIKAKTDSIQHAISAETKTTLGEEPVKTAA
jgi:hypothetical protein